MGLTSAVGTDERVVTNYTHIAVGGWWLVGGGWWVVVGSWRLGVGSWWLVVGGWWVVHMTSAAPLLAHPPIRKFAHPPLRPFAHPPIRLSARPQGLGMLAMEYNTNGRGYTTIIFGTTL